MKYMNEKTSNLNQKTLYHTMNIWQHSKKKFLNIPNIKFWSVKDTFQREFKDDIPKIKQSLVVADKTNSVYEMREH